ncbi:uncharacterized protein LOC132698264 isoform X2 [Cylas formicarius]|uniref:uncharacterized protein LOC132698264 isoform X2 n=1 Tax=Cylas formicarius TaxID=197179 RepID=UPI0029586F88|nr:uncharacterized protein LOC132698264 isoform X2 [Cylas formicarius]
MRVQKLNLDIISRLRSGFNVNSISHCIFELVSNSLDAKSTSIAVRVNLTTFRIQVADNGEGITKENMEFVGTRYFTNKCCNLKKNKNSINTYGFRGEALASTVDVSQSVNMTSRHKQSVETYCKILNRHGNPEVTRVKYRPSCGTTVTVNDFLYNFPIRRNRIVPELDLDEIKKSLECLMLVNPETSFSLRNDVTGLLIFNGPKSADIIESFRILHPDVNESFVLLKVSKHKLTVECLVHKDFVNTARYQYMYVNKRPIINQKLQKFTSHSLMKEMAKQKKKSTCDNKKYPIFVLNIKCPPSFVDICMNSSKAEVEFKNWNLVFASVEKIVKSFTGIDQSKNKILHVEQNIELKSSTGMSHMHGVVQARAFKRNSKKEKTETNVAEYENDLSSGKNQYANADKANKTQNLVSPENYLIQNTESERAQFKSKIPKSIMRKPLQIRIEPKFAKTKNEVVHVDNMVDEKVNKLPINLGESNNERDGKNLIMDMFLKSTQIYQPDCQTTEINHSTESSQETILESNFVVENKYQDKRKGINGTVSISVNMKRKRMKEKNTKRSKAIQTNLTSNSALKRTQSNLSDLTCNLDHFRLTSPKRKKHFSDNYTILMTNTVRKETRFKFVPKTTDADSSGESDINDFQALRFCHCKLDEGNIFNFARLQKTAKCEVLPSSQSKQPCAKTYKTVGGFSAKHNKINKYKPFVGLHKNIYQIKRRNEEKLKVDIYECENPYFTKKTTNIKVDYENFTHNFNLHPANEINRQFIPNDRSKRGEELNNRNCYIEKQMIRYPKINIDEIGQENYKMRSTNHHDRFEQSTYFFKKEMASIDPGNDIKKWTVPDHKSERGFSENVSEYEYEFSCANKTETENQRKNVELENNSIFFFSSQNANSQFKDIAHVPQQNTKFDQIDKDDGFDNNSNLAITLITEAERQEMFEKELHEKQIYNELLHGTEANFILSENANSDNLSQQTMDRSKFIADSQNIWIRQYNERGDKFYVNKRTGISTFEVPKIGKIKFNFDKRLGFIPKGMSPILKKHKEVDRCLSQNTKTKLHAFMLQSIDNEVMVIKWQNYIGDAAIKFGDLLDNKTCSTLISKLSQCTLPFQCAHGRPTLMPLVSLNQSLPLDKGLPNLGRLGSYLL